jgi:hypothetical protein
MDKKKKTDTKIDDTDQMPEVSGGKTEKARMVTQIVEVVEIDNIKSQPDKIDIPSKTEHVEGVEKETEIKSEDKLSDNNDIPEQQTESDTEKKVTVEDDVDIKPKQVVEELFNKPDTENLMEISINRKNSKRTLMIWAIIVIVAAFVTGGGLLLLTNKKPSEKNTAQISPTPAASAVSPTVKPTIVNRGELTVQVLNGGGVPGAASKMKNLLTEKGYLVKDTGNTDEYSYDKTEILVKPGKEGALDLLKNDLKDSYVLGTTAATLSSDVAYDVRVIAGKE